MPKLLCTIGSLGLGGTESQMAMLIANLSQRGWRCELFALEASGPMRDILEQHGIVIHDGGYDSSARAWQKVYMLVRALFHLWRIARRMDPDVLHAYLPLANLLGALAGRMARVNRIVTSRRALGTHQDRHWFWKTFDCLSNALSYRVTVNSRAVWNDTVVRDGIDPAKLVLIYNGLDTTHFDEHEHDREAMRQTLGLTRDDVGIVMVANLIPYKGHVDLLRALPKLLVGSTDVRVFFVGEDRGMGSTLERLADDLEVSGDVVFLGRRNDIPAVLMAMDIYVMASHEEGSSNALLEAMAAGLPIIATDVGGNREALGDGRWGILVPPCNPDLLASAVAEMLSGKSQRIRMEHSGRTNVQAHYSIAKMVEAHIELYTGK